MLQLTGDVDNRDALIESLEDERDALKAELERERKAGREGARAVAALRKQLTPLYQALQMVFGHMDAVSADAPINTHDPRIAAVWQNWKNKIGGQPAQLIDALLLHGELTPGQIAVAIGINPKNVAQVVHKLNHAGIINKNGGKVSLKQL